MFGKKDWFFPDAELPPPGEGELLGHESIIVLNPNDAPADVAMRLYFEDGRVVPDIRHRVEPRCVLCIRTNNPRQMNGFVPQVGEQYAISLHSSAPIVAQYGRLDNRQANMAFYTTPGYCE